TIGALQQSFGNAVMGWQRELRLNGGMARITELGLRLTQQALCQPAILFGDPRRPKKMSLSQWSLGVLYPNGFGQVCRMAGWTGCPCVGCFHTVDDGEFTLGCFWLNPQTNMEEPMIRIIAGGILLYRYMNSPSRLRAVIQQG